LLKISLLEIHSVELTHLIDQSSDSWDSSKSLNVSTSKRLIIPTSCFFFELKKVELMKVLFRVIGKTSEKYLTTGIEMYAKRLRHYLPFEMEVLPDIRQAKNLSNGQLMQKEGELLLNRLTNEDFLILLDENGKAFTSVDFAGYLERQLQLPFRRLIFQVGGAFGFSDEVYARANAKLALSPMTFSHQMARLFFLEQLYRAMTILRNEPYHNN